MTGADDQRGGRKVARRDAASTHEIEYMTNYCAFAGWRHVDFVNLHGAARVQRAQQTARLIVMTGFAVTEVPYDNGCAGGCHGINGLSAAALLPSPSSGPSGHLLPLAEKENSEQ